MEKLEIIEKMEYLALFFLPSSFCIICDFFEIMQNHAKSCKIVQNRAKIEFIEIIDNYKV